MRAWLMRFGWLGLFSACAVALGAAPRWETDLTLARERAAAEQKALLIDFTGSTWCPPCIALDQEVLQTKEFAAWASDLILVKLDYPTSRERTPEKIAADPALRQLMTWKDEYAVPGFPTLILVGVGGEEVSRVVGYSRGRGPKAHLAKLRPVR